MKPSETQTMSTSSHTSPSNSSNSSPMPQSTPTSSSDPSTQTQLQQTDSAKYFSTDPNGEIISISRDQFSQKQAEVMSGLEQRFGAGKVSQHTWDWVYGLGDWIPQYQFGERLDREGIWQEHILGIGGQLSMQELEEQ
ncbi:hypothetical protein Moror_5699 [Moniliophthora roreri MCA 2997]|uniref:Uncharacterized protein n=2 Tax=Moniliophthora roreri TaxID=221103 RepID=V2XTH4_MONRO|nr:hypothetical protein Moror_5699 [Moniliophthora roreri MCA 2997]